MISDWLVSSTSSSFKAVEIMPDVARQASAVLARFSAETMFVLARKKRTIPQPWATAIPPMTINAIVVSKRIVARIITAPNFPQGLFLTLNGVDLPYDINTRRLSLIRQCQPRTRSLSDTRPQQRHKRNRDGLQLQRKVYQRM